MLAKKTIMVICGGSSVEHEVSLWSAKNIVTACQNAGYDVKVIFVSKDGQWHYAPQLTRLFVETPAIELLSVITNHSELRPVVMAPGHGLWCDSQQIDIDVVFPIIHGTTGEDGKIQGLLDIAKVPYVGCNVLASALAMDKLVSKILIETTGIKVAPYLVVSSVNDHSFQEVEAKFSLPFFVKPTSLGSSIGVSKVRTEQEFVQALELAFSVDDKALIEKMIIGQELECSLLTDGDNKISAVGEVFTTHDFYSFDAKYLDEPSVTIKVPADISPEATREIRDTSLKIVERLGLEGMSRIDFFYTTDDEAIFNEVNTVPGFTAMSMYPRLWKAEGYTDESLIEALINHALDKGRK